MKSNNSYIYVHPLYPGWGVTSVSGPEAEKLQELEVKLLLAAYAGDFHPYNPPTYSLSSDGIIFNPDLIWIK